MRVHTMTTALFGKVFLIPHLAAEVPAECMVGYVDFGDETHLVQGTWLGESWLDQKGKPFADPIARWYHVEAPDGSRPF